MGVHSHVPHPGAPPADTCRYRESLCVGDLLAGNMILENENPTVEHDGFPRHLAFTPSIDDSLGAHHQIQTLGTKSFTIYRQIDLRIRLFARVVFELLNEGACPLTRVALGICVTVLGLAARSRVLTPSPLSL